MAIDDTIQVVDRWCFVISLMQPAQLRRKWTGKNSKETWGMNVKHVLIVWS